MKFYVTQFSSPSRHFIFVQSKYPPQHPVLKHPQSMFVSQYHRPSFTPIQNHRQNYMSLCLNCDRLCSLVVRVLGYRSGCPGSIPGNIRKQVVGLERGPLSLVSTTEVLLERKVAAPV
jgi:hypothetical protein